jgi:hypothetical protein
MTRTTLSAMETRAILKTLTEKTPQALRQLLIEPDHILIHDFYMSKQVHDDFVWQALRILT